MIKRYPITLLFNQSDVKQEQIYLCSDIDPILKAARVVAKGWQALTNRPDCKCDSCQAARLIIEKTEGLDNE